MGNGGELSILKTEVSRISAKGENKSVKMVVKNNVANKICTCITVPSQVNPSPVKPDRHVHVTPLPGNKNKTKSRVRKSVV